MLYNVWNTNQTATMQTQVLTKKQPLPPQKKTTQKPTISNALKTRNDMAPSCLKRVVE